MKSSLATAKTEVKSLRGDALEMASEARRQREHGAAGDQETMILMNGQSISRQIEGSIAHNKILSSMQKEI